MISDAQIEANRRNALKSTGPKTERGKERSRLNALRHGMTAKQLVVSHEDFGDFARFGAEPRAALAPGDALEEQLVESIVMTSWRLRRAWRTEAATIQLETRRADAVRQDQVAAIAGYMGRQRPRADFAPRVRASALSPACLCHDRAAPGPARASGVDLRADSEIVEGTQVD